LFAFWPFLSSGVLELIKALKIKIIVENKTFVYSLLLFVTFVCSKTPDDEQGSNPNDLLLIVVLFALCI
jgi:hypothetical protein